MHAELLIQCLLGHTPGATQECMYLTPGAGMSCVSEGLTE